ncbi:MAG TPA: polyprenyl synthetase family protein [Candidatus Avacidaminococcus intestinavium]|uniref:Farnesyl diphosphate synthase n=1 Tax=Candidatus Avacidaminococcus intestinavium TaxID=2840684 RepID=A0A9D1SKS6_9FIRM|nr:polyprenyl synthetase family protein [Candidatus Avacidaminococcus intestinavium]
MNFPEYYESRKKLIESFLIKQMQKKGISRVDEAMSYSLLAGGKRLRPLLVLATGDVVCGRGYDFLAVACGLEMIHTYSLIHDDLPVMDNDDYRRGRLTNHKVYGDALALLAGDGLLTLAFEVMLEQKNVAPAALIETVKEVAMCSGSYGMVGGQALDIEAEGKNITEKDLRTVYSAKTGALFIAAVRAGARLSGAKDEELLALTRFAELFGLGFQISDDIMDVEGNLDEMGKNAGSDAKLQKTTFVTLCTLEGAKELVDKTFSEALMCLESFGSDAEPLRELTLMVKNRKF